MMSILYRPQGITVKRHYGIPVPDLTAPSANSIRQSSSFRTWGTHLDYKNAYQSRYRENWTEYDYTLFIHIHKFVVSIMYI